jgi:hypothetical protein
VIYHAMSLTIVSVSLRRVIGLSQWFIMLCLTTVSVSLRRVIGPSQWFIMPCLWLLYQYLQEEWYVYHSDLSCHVSDYCISISKKSDMSITVIYHAMSLTTVSVSPRRVIRLSQWFIMLCLWLLYQYLQEEWYVYHWFIMPCLWLLHQYHLEDW